MLTILKRYGKFCKILESFLRKIFEKWFNFLKKRHFFKERSNFCKWYHQWIDSWFFKKNLKFYSIFPINNIQFTVPVPSKLKSNMTWKFFICHFKKKPKENCNIACNYVLQKNTFWRNIVPQKVFSKKINSTKHKATKTLYIF